MGWLIITIAFLVLGLFLFWHGESPIGNPVVGFLGLLITICSFVAVGILTILLVSQESDAQVDVDQYNNTVELIQDLGVPSEAIMTEIIKTNDKIIEHRVKSNKFMTRGLYSKKVAALPLLEIPEVMKVGPIDYE